MNASFSMVVGPDTLDRPTAAMPMTSPHPPGIGRRLRVGIDTTPLLGQRTGIGRFVRHLVDGLAPVPEIDLRATAFTLRGWKSLSAELPPGVRRRGVPVPARALRKAWSSSSWPPVEWLAGRMEVFHATNYVLPPLQRAAGVLSVHDLSYLHLPATVHQESLIYRDLVPRGLRRAAVVCALTSVTADEIAQTYRFPRERIVVTPLGVDETWFQAETPAADLRSKLALPTEYLLFVGTREPRKGLDTLAAAYGRLRADNRDVPPLVLIGGHGWGAALPVQPGIITLPYLAQADLPAVVAGAAALVMPSVYEGFGLPILEAMACGTPVIISDSPAMREVAGGRASVFPVGDIDALAAALVDVLAGRHPTAVELKTYATQWTWSGCVTAAVTAYVMASQG